MAWNFRKLVEDYSPGLSWREISRRSGVPLTTLTKWGNGGRGMSADRLARVLDALGVPEPGQPAIPTARPTLLPPSVVRASALPTYSEPERTIEPVDSF